MIDNKFHAGNGSDGKHYWLTPPDVYTALDAEFHFDFDPCPYPLPDGFDGLTCEWGHSNYVNPPFGSIVHNGRKKGATAWVRKAIEEHRKGKTVVFVYPIDKWVLMLLAEIGAEVRNLGDIRWRATEDGTAGHGTGRHIACFVLRSGRAVSPLRSSHVSDIWYCTFCGEQHARDEGSLLDARYATGRCGKFIRQLVRDKDEASRLASTVGKYRPKGVPLGGGEPQPKVAVADAAKTRAVQEGRV